MNKNGLIKAIAGKTGCTESAVKVFLDAFIEITMKQVAKNDSVWIGGFGTFEKHRRAARTYWGFDGTPVKRKATTIPVFKAGAVFKRRTQKGR